MRIFCILLLSIVLSSCVKSSMTSFIDPSHRGQKIDSVAVFGNILSLEQRQSFEQAAVDGLASRNIRAYRGIDVAPPTRQMGQEEMISALKKYGINYVVVATDYGQDASQIYIPQQHHGASVTSNVTGYGNYATVNSYYNPGFTSGGYNIEKKKNAINLTMYKVDTAEQIWQASGEAKTTSVFLDSSDLAKSLANQMVSKLTADGLIPQ